MSIDVVVTALAAAAAVGLAVPGPLRPPPRPAPDDSGRRPERPDWLQRWRWLWTVLATVAAATFVGGVAGIVAGPVAAAVTWRVVARAEPASVRRDREAAQRDLPHVVGLLADALRSGRSPTEAIAVVAEALPGPASARLARVVPRLRLGADAATVWAELSGDEVLGPLGRALERAHRSGASVVATVDRLAEEVARAARAGVEQRAHAIGVRAAVPLGLCLLPSFVVLGIVPVVGALMTGLGL